MTQKRKSIKFPMSILTWCLIGTESLLDMTMGNYNKGGSKQILNDERNC